SGLYLAGPSLVKAAIGQIVDAEELGGAQMHAEISGTVDFFEKDDPSCLKRLRSLVELLPEAKGAKASTASKEPSKPAKNSGAVCNGLQSNRLADYLFPGCHWFHGGARCGTERDHSQWREVGERSQQFRRAEDHGRCRWIIRRRELRHVRQGI